MPTQKIALNGPLKNLHIIASRCGDPAHAELEGSRVMYFLHGHKNLYIRIGCSCSVSVVGSSAPSND